MRTVSILGSTGSIGHSTLEVLPELADTHRVTSLVAHSNAAKIVAQARQVRPQVIGLADPAAALRAERDLSREGIEVLSGPDVAVQVLRATRPDLVVAAITGAAGLPASLEAVQGGAVLALANKEALVMAGRQLTHLARAHHASIVPVDSEHSAIFQALHGEDPAGVRRLILTASGGPFLDLPPERFASITPDMALRHPTWKMGRKISIDSATMMNKALEIVEACWLFAVAPDAVDVLIHPQSIVHSMVEFVDGSILAQMGVPCMTVPVRYALSYPRRAPTASRYFDAARFATLTFAEPDRERFPALALGHHVARQGGLAGTVLNAANEVAVAWFLEGRTSFNAITETAARVLDRMENASEPSLERIVAADSWARAEAERCLRNNS